MTARSKVALGVVASVIGALLLTNFFYRWPDLFPSVLRTLGNTLVGLSGSHSAEVNSDIELAFVLFACFVISGLAIVVVASVHSWLTHGNDA